MDDNARADLTEFMRRHRPARVWAILRDNTRREVAVGAGRGARWGLAASTIAAMGDDVASVELCDHAGALLDTWRPATLGAALADPSIDAPAVNMPAELQASFHVARLIQTAVDHAVDRHLRGLQSVVDGLTRIVQHQQDRLREHDRAQSQTLRLAYDAVRIRAEAEAALRAPAEAAPDPTDALVASLVPQLLNGHHNVAPPKGGA